MLLPIKASGNGKTQVGLIDLLQPKAEYITLRGSSRAMPDTKLLYVRLPLREYFGCLLSERHLEKEFQFYVC